MPLLVGAAASVKLDPRLFFFGDGDFEFGGDVTEDFYLDGKFAKGFDRVVELDLALVDLEALGFERVGDVAVGNRAEELSVFGGLARELKLDAVERSGLLLRRGMLGGRLLRQRTADALERFHIAGGGFDSQLLRQQKIARVAGLHVHDVAAVAELFNVFLKNYFLHWRFLFVSRNSMLR